MSALRTAGSASLVPSTSDSTVASTLPPFSRPCRTDRLAQLLLRQIQSCRHEQLFRPRSNRGGREHLEFQRFQIRLMELRQPFAVGLLDFRRHTAQCCSAIAKSRLSVRRKNWTLKLRLDLSLRPAAIVSHAPPYSFCHSGLAVTFCAEVIFLCLLLGDHVLVAQAPRRGRSIHFQAVLQAKDRVPTWRACSGPCAAIRLCEHAIRCFRYSIIAGSMTSRSTMQLRHGVLPRGRCRDGRR